MGKKLSKIQTYMIIEIVIITLVIIIDMLVKSYTVNNLQGKYLSFIPGLINITYVENPGAAFGILQGKMGFFYVITVVMLTVFAVFMFKKRSEHILFKISSAMIVGGAVGNFIDRVTLGYVIDTIDFAFMDFAVFNIADCALTVGATLFAVYFLFIYKEPKGEVSESLRQCTESRLDGTISDNVTGDLSEESIIDTGINQEVLKNNVNSTEVEVSKDEQV